MSERRPSPIDEAMDAIGAAFVVLGRSLRDGLYASQRSAYALVPPPEAPAVHGGTEEVQEGSQ